MIINLSQSRYNRVSLGCYKNKEEEIIIVEENIATDFLPFEFVLDGPNAEVGQTLGITYNLGNYQSIRFDMTLKVPVAPIKEEIDKAEEWVNNLLSKKLIEFRTFVKEKGQVLA